MGWGYRQPNDWPTIKARILRRDPTCRVIGCGKPSQTVDHIVNVARGGGHDDANLQGLCLAHHADKSQREATAARASMPKAKRKPERHPGLV